MPETVQISQKHDIPHSMSTTITLPPATEEHQNWRLDKYLTTTAPAEYNLSRERVKTLLADEKVKINNVILKKPSYKIAVGDEFVLEIPPTVPCQIEPEDIPLDVLYEDDDLLVLNKPAGIAVHPAPGVWKGTLVNALLHHCAGSLSGINGVERPGIVHRLDKETTGTMVVAKTDAAHSHLAKQFEERTLHRRYVALCYGCPSKRHDEIDAPIGRHPKHRQKMAVIESGYNARDAITHYQVLNNYRNNMCLVEMRLETGRTHQIRVHMSYLGNPVVGDPVYARFKRLKAYNETLNHMVRGLKRQMLHAAELGFIHPKTGEQLNFKTSPPADMQAIINQLNFQE